MITYIDDLEAEIKSLKEENKKLKDKIEYLEFDIEAWKKLKQQLEKYSVNLQAKYDLMLKLYNKDGTTKGQSD